MNAPAMGSLNTRDFLVMKKVLIYLGALGALVSIGACANNDAGKFKDGSSVNIKGTAELCNDILNGKAPGNFLCQDWRTFKDGEMQKAVMTINGYTKILQSGNSIKDVSQEYARSLVQDSPKIPENTPPDSSTKTTNRQYDDESINEETLFDLCETGVYGNAFNGRGYGYMENVTKGRMAAGNMTVRDYQSLRR